MRAVLDLQDGFKLQKAEFERQTREQERFERTDSYTQQGFKSTRKQERSNFKPFDAALSMSQYKKKEPY